MNLGQTILKILFPKREQERMNLRESTNINTATAEDLIRTFNRLNGEVIRKMMNGHDDDSFN